MNLNFDFNSESKRWLVSHYLIQLSLVIEIEVTFNIIDDSFPLPQVPLIFCVYTACLGNINDNRKTKMGLCTTHHTGTFVNKQSSERITILLTRSITINCCGRCKHQVPFGNFEVSLKLCFLEGEGGDLEEGQFYLLEEVHKK